MKKNNDNNKVLNIALIVLAIFVVVLGIVIAFKQLGNKGKEKDLKTEETSDVIIYDEEIKIDASLATQPLVDAYVEGLNNFNITKEYSNTDPAYTKLINGEVDLIIVTQPSEDAKLRAEKANVEYELVPVVNEGFVFYTNVNNKVNSLKLSDVQKIYTGEITNWKKLGGDDSEIIAYQRPATSGSQTGMMNMVMKNLKIKKPRTEEYVESMAGIIDIVSNYDNGKDAIGYSYYYYATTMYGNDRMKFFSIDGVTPTHETIKNETYPLITSYYIVTLKGNNKEVVKKLIDEMLSSRGQKIAKEAGYVELG